MKEPVITLITRERAIQLFNKIERKFQYEEDDTLIKLAFLDVLMEEFDLTIKKEYSIE